MLILKSLYFILKQKEVIPMLQKTIGKRVRDLRIVKLDMNQEQFAEKLGWDRTYISRVESGNQNITIENLNKICNALGVSLKDFFSTFDQQIIESE